MNRKSLVDGQNLVVSMLALGIGLGIGLGISLARPADVVAQVPSATADDIVQFVGGREGFGSLDPQEDTIDTGDSIMVPDGFRFLLTDLILSNLTNNQGCAQIWTGNPDGAGVQRTESIRISPQSATVINFNTTIGFRAGTEMTIQNCSTGAELRFTVRGYNSPV